MDTDKEKKRSRLRGVADSLVGTEVKEITSGQLVSVTLMMMAAQRYRGDPPAVFMEMCLLDMSAH